MTNNKNESVEFLKFFYSQININKSLIFNYLLVSQFERNLFISISSLIKDKYDYELKGLKRLHVERLKNQLSLDKNDIDLVSKAFELNSVLSKRAITMGYGNYSEEKIIKNYKLEEFIENLNKYILSIEKYT